MLQLTAHPRGEPYSALPNTAGGGEAAALCALPAKRAARRRAVISFWLSVPIYALPISRLWYSRRFAGKTEIADIEKAAAHAERGAGAKLCVPSRGVRFWFALLFCTRRLSIPRNISRPDKRRRPSEQRFGAPARRAVFGFAEYGRRRSRRPLRAAREAGSASPRSYPVFAREALNKSRHASCLHTRFNQHFPGFADLFPRQFRKRSSRGVLRRKGRAQALRKPRRTPSEGRERSSAFPREVCAFGLLCFFAHGGFQFPRNISHPDKRRRPNEQLSRTARTRARRFAARAIGRLRRPLLLPPAAFAGRAPLQTKKLPQPVLQQPFSVRFYFAKSITRLSRIRFIFI